MTPELMRVEAASTAHIPQLVTLDQLAEWCQPPLSWLRENYRSRCEDPLPVYRCGRYVRVDLNDPALMEWLNRRNLAAAKERLRSPK